MAAAPNLAGTASYDLAQATESERPHAAVDGGFPAFEGNKVANRHLAVAGVAPPTYETGDFGSLWVVLREVANSTQGVFSFSAGSDDDGLEIYRTTSSIRASSLTVTGGALLATMAFTDTASRHLIRATLLPAGLTIAADEVETTVSTANAGLTNDLTEIGLFSRASATLTWDGFGFEWVATRNEPSEVRAAITAFLAASYGIAI